MLILDASLLINFLKADRIDLIQCCSPEIMITEHVRDEVTLAYPDQLARLDKAIADRIVEVIVITDLNEIEEIVNFREHKTNRQLGLGECSAIILASKRKCSIGIDDSDAIKMALKEFPELTIVNTVDVVVTAIRSNVLSVTQADELKEEWATRHKFKLKFRSFAELLKK